MARGGGDQGWEEPRRGAARLRAPRGAVAPLPALARSSAQAGSLIRGAAAAVLVQGVQGQKQKQKQEARRPARRGRSGAVAAAAPTEADGVAEFREMFVSLVDPAGILDMERCSKTAALMGEAASRSGYEAGARMSSILESIFADTADIANRPVEDGALYHTEIAFRQMIGLLRSTAELYRRREGDEPDYILEKDGRPFPSWMPVSTDPEPVGKLEELRETIADLRSKADACRAELRAADPPGSGLDKYDAWYKGKICRDVVREDIEEIRAMRRARGDDPIFPPRPRPLDEYFKEPDGTMWSAADIIAWARGNGPPDGYEVVKVDDGE